MKNNSIWVLYISNLFAQQDLKNRYRRSVIGPFWYTISTAIMAGCIGLLFGKLFGAPMSEFLPFITIGLILWSFITGIILEGCNTFIDHDVLIKQVKIPFSFYVLRNIIRNIFILGHNIIVFPIVLLLFNRTLTTEMYLAIPGLLLVIFCLSWISLLTALLCTRYRDFPQIVNNILQVAFYLTPIIWMPSTMKGKINSYFFDINPFYHFLELIRAPLLGVKPDPISWYVVLLIGVIGWIFTWFIMKSYRHRIAYWL